MSRKPKILVICGLTASGKTSLALKVAKKTGNTSIISVDSRQAYQGLPVLTGQDIPPGFTRHQSSFCRYQQLPGVYFSNATQNSFKFLGRSTATKQLDVRIWGIDQVPPSRTLNISTFTKFVWQVIEKETLKGRKIIIVGGTGLYLKAITEPMLDIHLGFNQELRETLSKLSVEKLQKKLQNLSSKKFKNMNQSDQFNPRRLIRAIEILTSPSIKKPAYFKLQKNTLFHWVGLKPDLITLEKNIHARVLKRLKNKALNEVKALQKLQKNQKAPIYSALGLTPILKYTQKEISKKELIKTWVQADLGLAKRQLTWFKKQPSIIWYDQNSDQAELVQNLSLWLKKQKQ